MKNIKEKKNNFIKILLFKILPLLCILMLVILFIVLQYFQYRSATDEIAKIFKSNIHSIQIYNLLHTSYTTIIDPNEIAELSKSIELKINDDTAIPTSFDYKTKVKILFNDRSPLYVYFQKNKGDPLLSISNGTADTPVEVLFINKDNSVDDYLNGTKPAMDIQRIKSLRKTEEEEKMFLGDSLKQLFNRDKQ